MDKDKKKMMGNINRDRIITLVVKFVTFFKLKLRLML